MLNTTDIPDLPERSLDGNTALDLFYLGINSVNFYFEDIDQENLYGLVVAKVFPEYKIFRVFTLGGKSGVLKHALDEANIIVPNRIYTIDRDFDFFLNTSVELPGLFYTDYYCIENHFCEILAILEVVVECHPKLDRHLVAARASLPELIASFEASVRRLFLLFFIAQKFDLAIANTKLPIETFCVQKRPWLIDESAIDTYRDLIIRNMNIAGVPVPVNVPDDVPETFPLKATCLDEAASGKHLLKLVFHHLKREFTLGSFTFESFCYRVAKNSSLGSLSKFKTAVEQYLLHN